jgi:hypothetical protein
MILKIISLVWYLDELKLEMPKAGVAAASEMRQVPEMGANAAEFGVSYA